MLGFIAAVAGIVSRESMKRAVFDSIPKGSEELNLAAFQAGYEHGSPARAAGEGHAPAAADSSQVGSEPKVITDVGYEVCGAGTVA